MLNIKRYIKEVIEECKKLTFPKWKEVWTTSIYISIIVFMIAMAILLTDFVISRIIKVIFGLGL